MKTSLSIIVPCYKVEKYLDRCMRSLLSQQVDGMEIILVDDCSPDTTPALADAYVKENACVKVIHKPVNEGLGFARNTGLDAAQGDYVAFIDSDDFVETDMFATLLQESDGGKADAVYCNFRVESNNGFWTEHREVSELTHWEGDEVKQFLYDMIASAPKVKTERRFQMSVWHAIYRRELIESNAIRFRSEREVMSEDFPFHVDFLLKAKHVAFVPKALYHWCRNVESLTATFLPEKFQRTDCLYDLMCRQLAAYPEAKTRLQRFYIGYIRGRICNMFAAKHPDSDALLSEVMANKRWENIRKEYPSGWLPMYQRLFLLCILHRKPTLLKLLYKVVTDLKRRKNMRH